MLPNINFGSACFAMRNKQRGIPQKGKPMRMYGSLTMMAVVLLSPIHANAQDAAQVKWELYGKLAHLRHHQNVLINGPWTAIFLERQSSLRRAAQTALKEWDDLKLVVDKVRAENAKLQNALDTYNARCTGTIDKKFENQCNNKRADLIAWRAVVAGKFQKTQDQVEAKNVEMESIKNELKEIETQMEKKTAELRSVQTAIQTVRQMIDKTQSDERRSHSPSTNAVRVAHASACPTWLADPPSLPVESVLAMPKWAPKKIFTRDCIVTKPNGQTVLYKEGQEQMPAPKGGVEWEGSDEATEDEVFIGGKG